MRVNVAQLTGVRNSIDTHIDRDTHTHTYTHTSTTSSSIVITFRESYIGGRHTSEGTPIRYLLM